VTEEQLVYNTRGKTAGSSGEDQNTDHHKRSPSELDPPRVKKDNSAYADDVDADTLPASETLAPERLTLPRDPIMGVRIYSHALDRTYRRQLDNYKQQLRARLEALEARISAKTQPTGREASEDNHE
jgi:hypothetical protein